MNDTPLNYVLRWDMPKDWDSNVNAIDDHECLIHQVRLEHK